MVDKPEGAYRIYLRASERILCRHEFTAADDAAAIRTAELLADATADLTRSFELWQRARLVAAGDTWGREGGADGLVELDGAASVAEAILRSNWAAAGSRLLLSRLEAWRRRPNTSLLERLIREAVSVTGADTGNIQLRDGPGHLRIAAQHGHEREFLDYFAVVNGEDTSCGRALKRVGRVIVEDVATDPIFRDKPAGTMLMRSGLLSTFSTPIAIRGEVRGMLSTHRRINWVPDAEELRRIDGFVADAASAIG